MMYDREISAWLGDTDATDEQRRALRKTLDRIAARYPEQGDPDATTAGSAATQVILGDNTLAAISAEWTRQRSIERDAWAALTGAMIAAAATGMPETQVSEAAGVTRMTVRRALGKHRPRA